MISVNDLTFNYSVEQPLFENFSLDVQRGELFGLVGPNGAGKSSLISLICGLLRPHEGSIKIDGVDFTQNRKTILQKIAVVPQDYAFYPKLSARENLQFFASLYPELKHKADAIARAMEMTGIRSFSDRLAKTYSGGMKRRLNLAIGLLNTPELLILDEPTVGIDPQSRHFILQAIREINQQGTTVLYTSHYMEEVERLCQHVTILDHGKVLASGKLTELLSRRAKLKIRLSNPDTFNVHSISALQANFGLTQNGNMLSGDVQQIDQIVQIINELNVNGAQIEHIEYGIQSLESLFFELTDTKLRED